MTSHVHIVQIAMRLVGKKTTDPNQLPTTFLVYRMRGVKQGSEVTTTSLPPVMMTGSSCTVCSPRSSRAGLSLEDSVIERRWEESPATDTVLTGANLCVHTDTIRCSNCFSLSS